MRRTSADRWTVGRLALHGTVAMLLVSLAAVPAQARKARPRVCSAGRFLVQGNRPLLSAAGGGRIEAVAFIPEATLAITSGCPAVAPRLKPTRKGTRVVASWLPGACPGLKGRPRLTAHIDAACRIMHGRLRARKFRRRFVAHLSECGDGVLDRDGGERCDRLEGAADTPALSAIADLDLEAGSALSEFDRSADGRRIVRTRLEIGFPDSATVGDVNRVLAAADARIVMMLEHVPILLVRIPDPGSVAALEDVITRVVADPAVAFVDEAGVDEADEVPENFSPVAASAPAGSGPDFSKIDHHLAIRAAAAWNARGAVHPGAAPTIVVADKFGDGPPDGAVGATFPVPADFATGNPNEHGYHITGILAGSFGGARHCDVNALGDPVLGDAAGRDCVTGMFPGAILMRAVDVQEGLTQPARQDKLIQLLKAVPGNVVVSESLGLGVVLTPDQLQRQALTWLTKVRGGVVSNGTVGAGLEGRFLHVTSAGNLGNGTLARTNSAPNAAALLPGLAQVVPIPNLTNVVAVENAINTVTFEVACLKASSCVGGQLSGIGTQVWSLLGATAGADNEDGTSQAAPQVAGLAAYVWSLAPDLTPQQLAALLKATALRTPVTDAPPVVVDCGSVPPAPTVDAYEAVLSVDAAGPPDPSSSPVRAAILDVDGDGDFDADDLAEFVGKLIDPATGLPRESEEPDFSRWDLNGDGFTGKRGGLILGTPRPVGFDLDRTGSQQFGAPALGPGLVTQVIEDVAVPFDEREVSDLAILCFYAYSNLYQGDPVERRELLEPVKHCLEVRIDAQLPDGVASDADKPLVVDVTVAGPDGTESDGDGLVVELAPSGGSVGDPSGVTDRNGRFATTARLGAGQTALTVHVTVRNAENGLVLGEGQVTSGPRGNFLGEWQGEIETESGGQTVNACGNEPHCARLTVQPTDTGLRVGYCNSVESQCAGSALAQTCALLLDATPTGNGFTGVGVNNNPPCCIGCVGQNRVYGCAITATHTIDAFGQETLTGTLGGGVTFCPPEGTADVVTHFTFCRPNPCPVAPPPPPGGD